MSAARWRLALRGHQELVLENLALRQQLAAVKRRTKRSHLQSATGCFGLSWPESGRTDARLWRSFSRTPSCAGIATGSVVVGPDVRNRGRTAAHLSISRSTPPRSRHGDREPVVGSTANSWRATHTRCRHLRTQAVDSGSGRAAAIPVPHTSARSRWSSPPARTVRTVAASPDNVSPTAKGCPIERPETRRSARDEGPFD